MRVKVLVDGAVMKRERQALEVSRGEIEKMFQTKPRTVEAWEQRGVPVYAYKLFKVYEYLSKTEQPTKARLLRILNTDY